MKSLVIVATFVVFACAKPATQLGNYKVNYRTEELQRNEEVAGGKVVGSYSYKDDVGEVHTIQYVASADGFQATGDLPQETAEVAQARRQHLESFERERVRRPVSREKAVEKVEEPKFVHSYSFSALPQETQEVALARRQHLETVERERAQRPVIAQEARRVAPVSSTLGVSRVQVPAQNEAREVDNKSHYKVVELVPPQLVIAAEDTPEDIEAKALHLSAHTLALAQLIDGYERA